MPIVDLLIQIWGQLFSSLETDFFLMTHNQQAFTSNDQD